MNSGLQVQWITPETIQVLRSQKAAVFCVEVKDWGMKKILLRKNSVETMIDFDTN